MEKSYIEFRRRNGIEKYAISKLSTILKDREKLLETEVSVSKCRVISQIIYDI